MNRQYRRTGLRYNRYLELRTIVLVEQKGRCAKCSIELLFFHYLIPKLCYIEENSKNNHHHNLVVVCKSPNSKIPVDIDFWWEEIIQQEQEADKKCVICGEERTGVYTYSYILYKDCRVRSLQHWEEFGIWIRIQANGQDFSSNEG